MRRGARGAVERDRSLDIDGETAAQAMLDGRIRKTFDPTTVAPGTNTGTGSALGHHLRISAIENISQTTIGGRRGRYMGTELPHVLRTEKRRKRAGCAERGLAHICGQ